MRPDFCAFILSHGRPFNVYTHATLRRSGYTGPIYIVLDDEDDTAEDYIKEFGRDSVVFFSKSKIAQTFDAADNFNDRRCIVYARNASYDIAEKLGYRYFIQLDDDYTEFSHRYGRDLKYNHKKIKSLDRVFSAILEYFISTPILSSVAIAQGGDFIGGSAGSFGKSVTGFRKAMNTFICDTVRRVVFRGRINEDVNTYTSAQLSGEVVFLTTSQASITQKTTQKNSGGMTDIYLANGTYVKSFYSIIFAPSCVQVSVMGDAHMRIHHKVSWNNAAPKIIRETFKKR